METWLSASCRVESATPGHTPNRYGAVENEIFDLFMSLDATEEQLDYPTLYASGKNGWCAGTYEEAINNPPDNMNVLFETIEKHILPPVPKAGDATMLVTKFPLSSYMKSTLGGERLAL